MFIHKMSWEVWKILAQNMKLKLGKIIRVGCQFVNTRGRGRFFYLWFGNLTNMTTTPIYGKNLKKSSSSEPVDQLSYLRLQHWVLKFYQDCLHDDLGLTLTI